MAALRRTGRPEAVLRGVVRPETVCRGTSRPEAVRRADRLAALLRQSNAALLPLLWCVLLLPTASATRPPPPPAFDLAGACAGVKSSETWKDSDGNFHWSYKIKVYPWTTFGRIRVSLHGWSMALEKAYYGQVDTPGKEFDVVLHPRPGPDDSFEIQGTGEAYAEPGLECAGLQMANASNPDCLLGPQFVVESDWTDIASGRFRAHVHMNLWVLQTIITMDYGHAMLEIGSDLNGARILEGGDGSSSKAVLSLLPLKNCLGMYKDASCDRSFSFTAVLTPPLYSLPSFSCLLTRDLPFPPPPMPPGNPPAPPPGFNVDPNLCYLGGYAHFSVPPQKGPKVQPGTQLWELSVHLNNWLPGLRVVLDFPGSSTVGHPLHVNAWRPAEVVRLLDVTRHSAILELQVTAARDFQFEALGDVDDVRIVCEVGDARPPPPPPPAPPLPPPVSNKALASTVDEFYAEDGDEDPPPHATTPADAIHKDARAQKAIVGRSGHQTAPVHERRSAPPPPPPPHRTESSGTGVRVSLFMLLAVVVNVLLYRRDPACYMLNVAQLVRWGRKKANKTMRGRKIIQFVGSTIIGRAVLQTELRYLGVASAAVAADDTQDKLLASSTGKAPPASKGKGKHSSKRKPLTNKSVESDEYDEDEALAIEMPLENDDSGSADGLPESAGKRKGETSKGTNHSQSYQRSRGAAQGHSAKQ
ncbi:hypothetical protein AB1Y20_004024 [Prymnesium parvum]|uniref:Uncharacterized protein n=1 Tax=Prymnesium parvum TaxID=97485 RepID=A0AB34J6D7_PRYPA